MSPFPIQKSRTYRFRSWFTIVLVAILQLTSAGAITILRIPRGQNLEITDPHFSADNGGSPTNYKVQNTTATNINRDDLITQAFNVQNCYRAKHQAAALSLDPSISQTSQSWADHLAATGTFEHSGSRNYGENLFGASSSLANGGVPIYYWYKEWKDQNYDFSSNSGQVAGHFTQLVWKTTQRVGFGIASNQNNVYVVANYYPPGNVQGQFLENVSPPSDDNVNSCAKLQPGQYVEEENILVLASD